MKISLSTLAAISALVLRAHAAEEELGRCRVKHQDCMTFSSPKEGRSPLCATYGKVESSSVLSSCKASDFDKCRDACLDDKSCKAFGFSTSSSTCTFLGNWLKSSLKRTDGYDYGMTYFSRNCYTRKCLKHCPNGGKRPQLVRNPGFERDASSFKDWLASSTDKNQPKTGHDFAPQGRRVAYWAPAKADGKGASATFTQRLQRKTSGSEPFYFSAWVGAYGDGDYKPAGVTVTLDGSEVFSSQSMCADAPYCQSFGTDAMYQQISGTGVMNSIAPLLQIEFTSNSDAEHQVVYLDSVNMMAMSCSDN